jgi:hypothetical protein
MKKTFLESHKTNIQNLEDIIESIQEYLYEIQNKPRFRDERNRSQSVKEWLNLFIDCKLHLNQAFNQIVFAKEKSQSLYKLNQESLKQLDNFILNYPQLNFNTTENIQQNSFSQISTKAKNSNIDIFKAWHETTKNNSEIIKDFYGELKIGFDDYNLWISKTEKNLTLKHYDLNSFQSFIKNLFEENTLAKHLYEGIRVNRFYQIQIPISNDKLLN